MLAQLTGLALLAAAAPADVVWLEAERFETYGGWVNDSQFIDQMGSPYLLANGLGTPVADAVTTFELPAAGRWRLWVRARDWSPGHGPGRFQVLLAGRAVAAEFGASGRAGWGWEDGGVHDLGARVEVRLHDLTGYYGRCDALALAPPEWQPPADGPALAAARLAHGGVSRAVRAAGEFDVVVVGGGLAGCVAAMSAARLGLRVALLQNRPVLGGNASTEILVPPVGVWPHSGLDARDPRETGLVEEVRTAGGQNTLDTRYYSGRLLRWVRAEPTLTLHLETHVTSVEMASGQRLGAVVAQHTRTGERSRFAGRVFIDCTGDGSVGVAAGARYMQGREARAQYGEPLAPEQANATTMGNSLKYHSVATDTPQPFVTPAWATAFPTCDSFPARRHPPRVSGDMGWQWQLELGGTRDTYRDKEEIRDELLRLIYGLWGHLKNACPQHQAAAANHRLDWVGYVAGMRESRRLLGDYVFTELDLTRQTLHPDRIAYGSWGLDDHYSEGFFAPVSANHPYKGTLHSIPYRSLYSVNVDNLLMAGRNISASHIGMGTTRVMLTCAVMGQAAGTAAALCVRHATTPRGVHERHLDELQQQLLKDGAYLIDLPNRDPRDLARQATLTASSDAASVAGVTDGVARFAAGRLHAWTPAADAAAPHWVELGWSAAQAFNCAHVTFLTKALAPAGFRVEVERDGAWTPLAVVQQRLRRHVVALPPTSASRLRVVLDQPASIAEVRVYQEPPEVLAAAARAAKTAAQPDVGARMPWETTDAPPPEEPRATRGLSLAAAAKRFGGLLLDADQAEIVGDWTRSTHSTPYVGADYLNDGNASRGSKEVRFRPRLAQPGRYEIRLAYTALANRASNTPVTVRSGGREQTVRVDQRRPPPIEGLFVALGTFDLAAGDETVIIVGNKDADGYVIVDAVQLVAR